MTTFHSVADSGQLRAGTGRRAVNGNGRQHASNGTQETASPPPPTESGEPLVVARAIHKRFRHHTGAETAVLAGADLSLYRGELVAMIGPSGCGKSTLLNILCGLTAADSGRIELAPSLDGHIGYMQQYDALLPWLTVLQNCTMPLRLNAAISPLAVRRSKAERRKIDNAGRAVLAELGLTEHAEHYPHQLSGGMRQRVSCARAIITRPPLLLLDEPFRSLDGITREEMHHWYRQRVIGNGGSTATLLVTHDIHEAAELADRVLICSARPMRICAVIPAPPPGNTRGEDGGRRDAYARTLTEALRTATGNPS